MNARYQNPAIGRFASQDPVFLALGDNALVKQMTDQELMQILSDPQNLNSYAYGRNNPLSFQDPTGQWSINIFGFLPQSTQVSIGDGANYLYNNNKVWRAAMDHPKTAGAVVGVAGAAAAVVASEVATVASVKYISGAGTMCLANCTQVQKQLSAARDMAVQNLDALQDSTNKAKATLDGFHNKHSQTKLKT
jgi:RHS repeat-associated protein